MKRLKKFMFSDIINVALITVGSNIMIWIGGKLLEKQQQKAQLKKTQADTDKEVHEIKKIDADTITILTNSMQGLATKYAETNEALIDATKKINALSLKIESQDEEIRKLRDEILVVNTSNKELKTQGAVFQSAIFELQKENYKLKEESDIQRKLIDYERNEGIKLRRGIDKLINQLRSVPLSPIWEPSTTPIDETPKNSEKPS